MDHTQIMSLLMEIYMGNKKEDMNDTLAWIHTARTLATIVEHLLGKMYPDTIFRDAFNQEAEELGVKVQKMLDFLGDKE